MLIFRAHNKHQAYTLWREQCCMWNNRATVLYNSTIYAFNINVWSGTASHDKLPLVCIKFIIIAIVRSTFKMHCIFLCFRCSFWYFKCQPRKRDNYGDQSLCIWSRRLHRWLKKSWTSAKHTTILWRSWSSEVGHRRQILSVSAKCQRRSRCRKTERRIQPRRRLKSDRIKDNEFETRREQAACLGRGERTIITF